MSDDPLVNGVPLSTLKVVDLRKELENRGLSKAGVKKELVERLRKNLEEDETKSEEPPAPSSPTKSPVNSIVAKYREKQQAALESATREAQLIREQSTEMSPSKQGSESPQKSPEKGNLELSADEDHSKAEDIQESIPEDVDDQEKEAESESKVAEEPEERVEDSKAASDVVDEDKSSGEEENLPEPVAKQAKSPVKENEKSSEIVEEDTQEKVEADSVDQEVKASEPAKEEEQTVPEIDLEVEKEDEESAEEPERDYKVNYYFRRSQKFVTTNHQLNRKFESSMMMKIPRMKIKGRDLLLLKHLEKLGMEIIWSLIMRRKQRQKQGKNKKSERRSSVSKKPDAKDEEPKEKKPYVEDRFDFLKKISNADKESKKETTELGLVRVSPVSPAKHEEDVFIHVHRLRRPFTNKGLISLLKKFGEFDENEDFWIDTIKSNCIVKYATVEEARKARDELHSVIWPTGNPDCLLVDFCSEDRFIEKKVGKVKPEKAVEKPRLEMEAAPISPDPPSTSEEAVKNGEEHRERQRTPTRQKSEKGLDELFKKTKAKPFIYYLPLTTEEADRRWAERKALEEKRRNRETPPFRSNPQSHNRRRSPPARRRRSISRSPDRKRDRRSPPRRR
ncbi:unnamed protein product [Bursaphelenchus okinawaensis]|uniref:SAP domain-containing protein n=1 Tax=Bursaphelenchus okinawaensis TaxID=465554 RepID=A0A811JRY1_9BILA|nr:unnamed protein product [Bursaphelenchus okinawaensis]CAG9079734.1 unnamed protein product [Bursaphelenchus okinawaensis]